MTDDKWNYCSSHGWVFKGEHDICALCEERRNTLSALALYDQEIDINGNGEKV